MLAINATYSLNYATHMGLNPTSQYSAECWECGKFLNTLPDARELRQFFRLPLFGASRFIFGFWEFERHKRILNRFGVGG